MAIELFKPVTLPAMHEASETVLNSGQIANGTFVNELEAAMADKVGVAHAITTSDMTAAIHLILDAIEVGSGDDIACASFSCLSTTAALHRVGANPRWVDIDPLNLKFDLSQFERALQNGVKAVLAYHIAGYPIIDERHVQLCRDYNVILIEDCNAAFGTVCNGRQIGYQADFSVFSFYPNRQVNGIEGGLIATDNEAHAVRIQHMKRFGIDPTRFRDEAGEINANYDFSALGWTYTMPNLNAAIACAQLTSVSERQHAVRCNAERLNHYLAAIEGIEPIPVGSNEVPSYWVLFARAEQRNALLAFLKVNGVNASKLHHPNHTYNCFNAPTDALSGTVAAGLSLIALPCGWWLSAQDIEKISSLVGEFYE
jgi:perosamine synthetase